MNIRVTLHDPSMRRTIENAIERLLAMLDGIDGDPDQEESGDLEPEPLEPWLAGACSDLEHEPTEYGEGSSWSSDVDLPQIGSRWHGEFDSAEARR